MTKRKTGNTGSTSTASKSRTTTTTKKTTKQSAPKAKLTKATTKTSKGANNCLPTISLEQRSMMISEAAYFNSLNSESNGQDMLHWLTAEADIDARYDLGG